MVVGEGPRSVSACIYIYVYIYVYNIYIYIYIISKYYFTNRKVIWYPPTESCIYYCELLLVFPKKTSPVYIALSYQ